MFGHAILVTSIYLKVLIHNAFSLSFRTAGGAYQMKSCVELHLLRVQTLSESVFLLPAANCHKNNTVHSCLIMSLHTSIKVESRSTV